MARDRIHWYRSSLSGRSPCDVACAVELVSVALIVQSVGAKRYEYPNQIQYLIQAEEPILGITILLMDAFFLGLVDDYSPSPLTLPSHLSVNLFLFHLACGESRLNLLNLDFVRIQ